jgi:hypothetical protein
LELHDIGAAQDEAARTLAGFAWDATRQHGGPDQRMTIEVRDENGPVMEVKFSFDIVRKQ